MDIMNFMAIFSHRSRIPYPVCLALMVCMLVPHVASAQDLVLHRYVGMETDEQLEELLYLAAGVALIQQGLSSTREAPTADLLLLTHYSTHSNTVDLNYNLFRETSGGSSLGNVVITLPIDHGLDSTIADALWLLFETAGMAGSPSPDAKIFGLLGEPAISDLSMTRETASGTAHAEDIADGLLPEVVAPGGLGPSFTASTSLAGMMFIGESMEYLRYGLSGGLSFSLSWEQPARSFDLTATVSYIRAFNDAGVAGGPLYLGTTGLGLGLGTGTDKVYRIGAGIAGGAAFLGVPDSTGFLVKTVPYLEFGASIRVPLTDYIFIGGELRFLAAFDQELVIMGISPVLTIGKEL